jgi:hypothetical protein
MAQAKNTSGESSLTPAQRRVPSEGQGKVAKYKNNKSAFRSRSHFQGKSGVTLSVRRLRAPTGIFDPATRPFIGELYARKNEMTAM